MTSPCATPQTASWIADDAVLPLLLLLLLAAVIMICVTNAAVQRCSPLARQLKRY